MCMAPDDGCHEVPDAIAPIDIRFVSLAPTRILISLSVITNSAPIFIEPIPCLFSMPGMFPIAPGEGLAPGVGMCISIFCGDAPGDAEGIGMFICIFCGEAFGFGEAEGICMPGIF